MNKLKQEANAILSKLMEYNVEQGIHFTNKFQKELANQNALKSMGEFYDYEAAQAYEAAAKMCAQNISIITGRRVEQITEALNVMLELSTGKKPDAVPKYPSRLKMAQILYRCVQKKKMHLLQSKPKQVQNLK